MRFTVATRRHLAVSPDALRAGCRYQTCRVDLPDTPRHPDSFGISLPVQSLPDSQLEAGRQTTQHSPHGYSAMGSMPHPTRGHHDAYTIERNHPGKNPYKTLPCTVVAIVALAIGRANPAPAARSTGRTCTTTPRTTSFSMLLGGRANVMDAFASDGGGNGNRVGNWGITNHPLQRWYFVSARVTVSVARAGQRTGSAADRTTTGEGGTATLP